MRDDVEDSDRLVRQPSRTIEIAGVGDDEPSSRIFEQVSQTLLRVARVQDHVELSRFQDTQDGRHDLGATIEQQRDRFRTNAALRKDSVRRLVRDLIQVRVADRSLVRLDGHPVAMGADLLVEAPGDRLFDILRGKRQKGMRGTDPGPTIGIDPIRHGCYCRRSLAIL